MKENDFSDSCHGYSRISPATHTDGNLESEVHLRGSKGELYPDGKRETSSWPCLDSLFLLQTELLDQAWSCFWSR